jgi:hypothetical protein
MSSIWFHIIWEYGDHFPRQSASFSLKVYTGLSKEDTKTPVITDRIACVVPAPDPCMAASRRAK